MLIILRKSPTTRGTHTTELHDLNLLLEQETIPSLRAQSMSAYFLTCRKRKHCNCPDNALRNGCTAH